MAYFLEQGLLKRRKKDPSDAVPAAGVGEAALTVADTTSHGEAGVYFGQLGRRGVGNIEDTRVLGR